MQQVLCASPDDLAAHGTPQHPEDLLRHQCLYLDEHPTDRCWYFSQDQQQAQVTVHGRLASNHGEVRLNGAYQGSAWALYPSNRHVPPRLRVLIDFLTEKLAANAA